MEMGVLQEYLSADIERSLLEGERSDRGAADTDFWLWQVTGID